MLPPNDLGLKVGTKKEALWTRLLIGAEKNLEDAQNEITFQTELIKLCKNKILLEKRK